MSWISKIKKLEGVYFVKTGPTTARCRLCNADIKAEKTSEISLLAAVYRHFKERHASVLERAEAEVKAASRIDSFLG